MKERITILMPVYNGAKYLKETMDNVFLQTYRDFIFLIINDGSTDETEQIILSYTDSRINYVRNEKNLGLVKSLNKGIDLVETEFLARMDADDLWVKTKLEKQLQLLDERLDVGLCGTSIRKFGAYENDFYFPVDNKGLKVGFIFYCCMSHPSVVYRMSFLKETGLRYRENYFPAEDYKMWLDCLKSTQIYNIPEILVYYRQHENQITQDTNSAQNRFTNQVRWEIIAELSTNFTEKDKEFHLNRFLPADFESTNDYKLFKDWIKKLVVLNNKNTVFDKLELKLTLNKHLQANYYNYVKSTCFSGSLFKGVMKLLFTGIWFHLNMKYILKLIFGK